MLKAGGAKYKVLQHVKHEYGCPICAQHSRPAHRSVAMPHSYAFNKVVAVDTIYVDYLSRRVPYLNMVCHGTNFQQVRRLEQPTSEAAWRCFNRSWIAYFGAPEAL
eukprot:12443808-Alexandrium_andersonii.AAC.1